MASIEKAPTQTQPANGSADREQLTNLVAELREECANLRQALAKVQEERDLYLRAVYAHARETLELEDIDIAELERTSAGPVELIDEDEAAPCPP